MEWVETTAATVEQAKDALLDQLGVDEQEAEFEVLEEPKAGLFRTSPGAVPGEGADRTEVTSEARKRSVDARRSRRIEHRDVLKPRRPTMPRLGPRQRKLRRRQRRRKPQRTAPIEAPAEDRASLDPDVVQAMAEDVAEFPSWAHHRVRTGPLMSPSPSTRKAACRDRWPAISSEGSSGPRAG